MSGWEKRTSIFSQVEPTSVIVPSLVPNSPAPDDEEILPLYRQANDQKALAITVTNSRAHATQLEVTWPELWWTSLPNQVNIFWVTC